MSRRIIITKAEREISPWIALFLSLPVTGLGHIYAGSASQGIILFLLRIIAILSAPFYSILNNGEYMTIKIAAAIISTAAITIISPLHAFIISRSRKIHYSWYNSRLFYFSYSSAVILITTLCTLIFITCFEIKKLNEETPPLFSKGDLVVIKKINPALFSKGELILVREGSGLKILRIIGLPGEKISFEKGRFLVDDSELPLSIFTENELNLIAVTDFDVISEFNGGRRYPVIRSTAGTVAGTQLGINEYFVSPDDRRNSGLFLKVTPDRIYGRVDGALFSPGRGFIAGKSSLPSANEN